MNDTVTDTMTIDLTKSPNRDKVEYIKKKVAWHDKEQKNKRITIGKKDNFNVETGDEVYILTEKEFKRLTSKEEKSWWKKILR